MKAMGPVLAGPYVSNFIAFFLIRSGVEYDPENKNVRKHSNKKIKGQSITQWW